MKEINKDLDESLVEAGADSVKLNSAAEIKLMLVELGSDMTFLKLAALLIILLKLLEYSAI